MAFWRRSRRKPGCSPRTYSLARRPSPIFERDQVSLPRVLRRGVSLQACGLAILPASPSSRCDYRLAGSGKFLRTDHGRAPAWSILFEETILGVWPHWKLETNL